MIIPYPSPNYSDRPKDEISAIVFHDGEGTVKSDLSSLTDDTRPLDQRVSAHWYVDRAGQRYKLVADTKEAWHAGKSSYNGRVNWNAFSIGVESEHKKGQDWPKVQRDALHTLFRELIQKYNIKEGWVAAHKWIAVGRKFDPTDWPDNELHAWIHTLYLPALYTIPGSPQAMPCGEGFYNYYNLKGGISMFGFALTPEQKGIDSLGRECTWMRLERVVFKYVYGEGVHLALLTEAIDKHWTTA